MKKHHIIFAVLCAASITGCDMLRNKPDAPQTASLVHNLELVDSAGVHYGHVELDPLGGGRLFDSTGKLMGRIVTPEEQRPVAASAMMTQPTSQPNAVTAQQP